MLNCSSVCRQSPQSRGRLSRSRKGERVTVAIKMKSRLTTALKGQSRRLSSKNHRGVKFQTKKRYASTKTGRLQVTPSQNTSPTEKVSFFFSLCSFFKKKLDFAIRTHAPIFFHRIHMQTKANLRQLRRQRHQRGVSSYTLCELSKRAMMGSFQE